MPSYSAIRIRTADNEIKSEMIDKEDIFDFAELNEKINLLNTSKYPRLYYFVQIVFTIRLIRFMILFDISTEWDYSGWQPTYEVIHPIIYARAYFLGLTSNLWLTFWYSISEYYDWGWEL
jgi:hypothetical protein